MINGYFFENIFIESNDVVKINKEEIITPFFPIKLDFSVNNKKLKVNTAYDSQLKEHNITNIIYKKTNDFYFYKIKAKKIFEKHYENKYENIQNALTHFEQISENPIHYIILNELILNAYEHGNLEIDSKQKNELILNTDYVEYLQKQKCQKKKCFRVIVNEYENILIVYIKDKGKRFNVKKVYENIANGRGLKLISNKSLKLFYSLIENEFCVFLKKD